MGEIIQLSDEESEEIDKALWEYDKEHIKYRCEEDDFEEYFFVRRI